jgi:hypothetical protein
MKRSKFTDSQIMEALKRVDAGLAVPAIFAGSLPLALPPFTIGAPNMVVWTPR